MLVWRRLPGYQHYAGTYVLSPVHDVNSCEQIKYNLDMYAFLVKQRQLIAQLAMAQFNEMAKSWYYVDIVMH